MEADLSEAVPEAVASAAMMAATASGLSKVYGEGNTKVVALDDVDIGFEAQKLTAIMGWS